MHRDYGRGRLWQTGLCIKELQSCPGRRGAGGVPTQPDPSRVEPAIVELRAAVSVTGLARCISPFGPRRPPARALQPPVPEARPGPPAARPARPPARAPRPPVPGAYTAASR